MDVTATTKTCLLCDAEKSLDDFHRDGSKPDGRHPWCADCKNGRSAGSYARWTDDQRALHRGRVLRSRYGISPEMLDAMYELQEGCCAICGIAKAKPAQSKKTDSRDTLYVDHDHETDQVRGLLCRACNTGLGTFRDDIGLLVKAAAYLASDRP